MKMLGKACRGAWIKMSGKGRYGIWTKIGMTLLLVCLFAGEVLAQVTFERLLNSGKEPQNWMTYSGDYSGKRFSSLDQINTATAYTMVAKWVFQTGATGKLETSPLDRKSTRLNSSHVRLSRMPSSA